MPCYQYNYPTAYKVAECSSTSTCYSTTTKTLLTQYGISNKRIIYVLIYIYVLKVGCFYIAFTEVKDQSTYFTIDPASHPV